MDADATLAVAADGGLSTRIERLRSDPPLVLRPTVNTSPGHSGLSGPGAAHVSLAAAAAGPIGGDRLRLEVDIGAGATLVLRTVAATLALPGPHAGHSHSETTFRVGPGATLIWLPEPTIAARRCDHRVRTNVRLDRHARLITRAELLLGRHGEQPGNVRQRLRVTRGAYPVHDQELHIDHDEPGWSSAAVTGRRKALGNLLCVNHAPNEPALPQESDGDVAVLRLDEATTLVTALARDARALRRCLDRHMPAVAHADTADSALASASVSASLSSPPAPASWLPS